MVITYKHLNKIKFPVYGLDSDNWYTSDGLLFLDNQVLDDKNMPGDSLGKRRLQTSDPRLRKLTRQIESIQGIIKQKKLFFIDSNGVPFIYEKTLMCPLRYKKIKKVSKHTTHALIWIEGTPAPFQVPRPPEDGFIWAGILFFKNFPYILYEYAETRKSDTRRKI